MLHAPIRAKLKTCPVCRERTRTSSNSLNFSVPNNTSMPPRFSAFISRSFYLFLTMPFTCLEAKKWVGCYSVCLRTLDWCDIIRLVVLTCRRRCCCATRAAPRYKNLECMEKHALWCFIHGLGYMLLWRALQIVNYDPYERGIMMMMMMMMLGASSWVVQKRSL